MIPSLVDLFDDTVHPLAIPLADLALDVSNNWTSLDDLSPVGFKEHKWLLE